MHTPEQQQQLEDRIDLCTDLEQAKEIARDLLRKLPHSLDGSVPVPAQKKLVDEFEAHALAQGVEVCLVVTRSADAKLFAAHALWGDIMKDSAVRLGLIEWLRQGAHQSILYSGAQQVLREAERLGVATEAQALSKSVASLRAAIQSKETPHED